MGIGFDQALGLTWREYDYYSIGYLRRVERDWDRSRHIIAGLFNSSGFAKKAMKPQEAYPLPMLDKKVAVAFVPMTKEKINEMLKHIN